MTAHGADAEGTLLELEGRLFALYEKGRVEEARALVEAAGPRFPEAAARVAFWRACLLALCGRGAEALDVLEAGAAAGQWWAVQVLMADPDLASVRDEERFARLVATCRPRHARAVAEARAVCTRLDPPPGAPRGVLVALHGRMRVAADEAFAWRPAAARGWQVALAESAEPVFPGAYVWDDASRSMSQVRERTLALRASAGLDGTRTVLAGFSQGGGLALRLALEQPDLARGVVVVAPAVKALLEADGPARTDAAPPRVWLVTGEADPRHDGHARCAERLRARGVPIHVDTRPGLGHEYPPDFGTTLEQALDFAAGGALPG